MKKTRMNRIATKNQNSASNR